MKRNGFRNLDLTRLRKEKPSKLFSIMVENNTQVQVRVEERCCHVCSRRRDCIVVAEPPKPTKGGIRICQECLAEMFKFDGEKKNKKP